MTTLELALIILLVILAQVALYALYAFFRNRKRYAELVTTEPLNLWRNFTLSDKQYEDRRRSVCTLTLQPTDGEPLAAYRAGQYITIQVMINDQHQQGVAARCYTLSEPFSGDHYRISVKRTEPTGMVSSHLHDQLQVGDSLRVMVPKGHFTLEQVDAKPLIMIAGGVGITPLLSMLAELFQQPSEREVWLFYGVRDGSELIRREWLQSLAAANPNFRLRFCFSRPTSDEQLGVDYHHQGRIDLELLRRQLELQRYHCFVCGPSAMLESLVPALESAGVPSGQIHYESFAPLSLKIIRSDQAALAEPLMVKLSRSGQQLEWSDRYFSLLEFLEDHGVAADYGCRSGSCGSCKQELLEGEVSYYQQPDVDLEDDECLLCVGRPATSITLPL